MDISEEEIALFGRMTRPDVIALPPEQKRRYLYALQVKHRQLDKVANDLMTLLDLYNETNILTLIGPTGIGKTTLSKRLLKILIKKSQAPEDLDASSIPFIFITAPANGNKTISWAAIYKDILRQGHEVLIDKKQLNVVEEGVMSVSPKHGDSLSALRGSIESMFKNRNVRVLVIDEAFHLLRFGDYSAVMDTLKTLADSIGAKLLLIGSYDLFDLASEYGQVARRSEILHFERYHIDNDEDLDEFSKIIVKIQSKWPCEEIPAFSSISKELMEATLGCIGLLKSLMLRALKLQIENEEKWNPKFLSKAAKSSKLLTVIREEIETGETKVENATYGESLFSGEVLERAIKNMNAVTVDG